MPTKKQFLRKCRLIINKPKFPLAYAVTAGLVTFISVSMWTILSAKYNLNNADHLVNAQIFSSFDEFKQAVLPGAHTFLIKWPLFVLIALLGNTSWSYTAVTLLTVYLTVGSLAYLLYRIDSRPLVYPTLWLAMASVLVMTPIAPYPGALLPTNMAMIATRNVEYIVFIASILMFLKNRNMSSKWFWLSTLLLASLIATDKLFLALTIGASLIGLVIYAKKSIWKLAALFIDWLTSNIFAAFVASIIILVVSALFVEIDSSSGPSPYQLTSTFQDLVLGIFYGITGLLTNIGANPGYSTTLLSQFPIEFSRNLFSIKLFPYIINFALVGVGMIAIFTLIKQSFTPKKTKIVTSNPYHVLSLILVGASIVAYLIFVASKHYYVVDSRYLGISIYAVLISIAVYYSQIKKIDKVRIVAAGCILILSILIGCVAVFIDYNKFSSAVSPIETRSRQIAQILENRQTNLLVGDYWRVVPAKHASKQNLKILPMGNCRQTRDVLTTKAWQSNLDKTGFAYLLNLDGGNLTDYPNCTLQQIIQLYGKPNSTVLVDGTISRPKEYLLFYDNGINKNSRLRINGQTANPLLPTNVNDLTNIECDNITSVNVVAHQDDDLLFMNPDINSSIIRGECVRTIYVTAGDSGIGDYYYLSRQKGVQAAYSQMLGLNNEWIDQTVKLRNKQYVKVSYHKSNAKVSLIFMNLPDGNLRGDGFPASERSSLAKIQSNQIELLVSLDGQSSYGSDQIVDTLGELFELYQPNLIRTHSAEVGQEIRDHSDHSAVGQFTKQAYQLYSSRLTRINSPNPIIFYVGYPTHELEPNISGEELVKKQNIFLTYAQYDGSVCSTIEQCLLTPTYGSYLSRQYISGQ